MRPSKRFADAIYHDRWGRHATMVAGCEGGCATATDAPTSTPPSFAHRSSVLELVAHHAFEKLRATRRPTCRLAEWGTADAFSVLFQARSRSFTCVSHVVRFRDP
jgi:hypothetical protein